jgi:hypothetical protein
VSKLRALQDQPAVEQPREVQPSEEQRSAPPTAPAPIVTAPAEPSASSPPASAPAPAPGVMTPARPSTVAPPSPSAQERDRPAAAAIARVAGGAPNPQLGSLLDAGIAKLGALQTTPLVAPVALPEQPAVPIDVLLYHGRAAIERCLEIRDQVRTAGGPVDADTLDELFDLLDLALTD